MASASNAHRRAGDVLCAGITASSYLAFPSQIAIAVVAAALIAMLDLRVIAPSWFPEVAVLPFWPQFADHLMWGLSVGVALRWRWRRGVPKVSH
jgi:hypothetical protein